MDNKNHKKYTTAKSNNEIYLGTISTEIVGIKYYEGFVRPEEEVVLVREPDNEHDENAIRVENAGNIHVGYIPRQIASWLAKLIDFKKIRIDGFVNVSGFDSDQEFSIYYYPLSIKVYLLPRGNDIFKKNPSVKNKIEALHEVVRRAYEDVNKYSDPEITVYFNEVLSVILKRDDVLPETLLLINLFSSIAENQKEKKCKL